MGLACWAWYDRNLREWANLAVAQIVVSVEDGAKEVMCAFIFETDL